MNTVLNAPNTTGLLPAHGRIACSACFRENAEWGHSTREGDGWLLENNPCAWGSRDPKVLMLGFSKGTRQCANLLTRNHDDIPFSGFRPKLTQAMKLLGLLAPGDNIDAHIRPDELDWAFGSIVRCSVAKKNSELGKYEKSGDVIGSSARRSDGEDWIGKCTAQFLRELPPRLETVIMLSNDDRYVQACFDRIKRLRPATRRINDIAYGDERVRWVHIVHFGGTGFNHMNSWMEGKPNKQGRKQELAREALGDSFTRQAS
jgi:hypothetical protein